MTSTRTMEVKLQEIEGFGEESAGKKKSKFKSIKKFFGKRKRKETLSSGDNSLKLCQSTSDVTASPSMPVDYDSEDELQIHKSIVGSRALSHESIFIPETPQEPTRQLRVFSQENVSDRIRALQAKLQQSWRQSWKSGLSSPFGTSSKRIDDTGMSSEDDGLPRSPPETSLLQDILNSNVTKFSDPHKHLSSLSLAGTGSEEEEQVPSSPSRSCSAESHLLPRQSGAKITVLETSASSLLLPAGFDTPPEFSSCLDNSAAKHKLLVKPRNQRSSRKRRPLSRNLSESQSDLSCTLEESESEQKEIQAERTNEGDSFSHLDLTESTVFAQKPEMPKGLQHTLNKQNEKACVPQAASELDSLSCENNAEVCQMLQESSHTSSLSPSFVLKEDKSALVQTPDQKMQREKEHKGTPKISHHIFLSGRPFSVPNQDNTWTCNTPSKQNTLSDKTVSTKNDVISILDRREKKPLKDAKPLLEEVCRKETTKTFHSTNSSTESSFQLADLPLPENINISQFLGTVPASQTDRPSPFALDKVKASQEWTVPEKDHSYTTKPDGLIGGGKAGKEASELNALKKTPLTPAWGKSRSSNLNMKENLECENPLTAQVFQAEMKNSSRSETVKEDAADIHSSQEQKSCTKKQSSTPEMGSEVLGRTASRAMIGSLPQAMGSKQTLDSSSTGLPQQANCEEKNPFQVKLRSTSLSLKHRDSSFQETKDSKICSADLSLEKEDSPLAPLKSEKPEVRKTADVNSSAFLNEGLKKSSEQVGAKPPLPRKPIMQHFIIIGTSSNINKPEKVSKYPDFKNEDKDMEKKSSPSEVLEKCVPSVSAADPARTSESQRVPAWITIAKQKQRVLEQDINKEEKPMTHEKGDTEKQTQEKVEEAVRQQTDYTRNTLLSFPPTTSAEEPIKETKTDTQESLPKVQLLSHPNTVPSSVPFEKESTKSVKKMVHSCPDQPSWMELAKKKSQAWSDMPQRIK